MWLRDLTKYDLILAKNVSSAVCCLALLPLSRRKTYPIHFNLLFCGFSLSRVLYIHVILSSRLSAFCTHNPLSDGWHVKHSSMSKAHYWTRAPEAEMTLVRSSVYEIYINDPRTEPLERRLSRPIQCPSPLSVRKSEATSKTGLELHEMCLVWSTHIVVHHVKRCAHVQHCEQNDISDGVGVTNIRDRPKSRRNSLDRMVFLKPNCSLSISFQDSKYRNVGVNIESLMIQLIRQEINSCYAPHPTSFRLLGFHGGWNSLPNSVRSASSLCLTGLNLRLTFV